MIKIYNRQIGKKFRPFIIAEACINHDGNFNKAIKMIERLKKLTRVLLNSKCMN